MKLFRRREIPPQLADRYHVFGAQAERLQQARRAVMSCLPVGRIEPAPVSVGLDLLADELAVIAADLPRWRVDEVADEWEACRDAVSAAREGIRTAQRVAATTTELEELLGALQDVDEPLGHTWQQAERAWRALMR